MAGINSTIRINDGMSPALKSMNKALNIVLNSFESLQSVSSNAIDVSDIRDARTELRNAAVAVSKLEEELRDAGNAQENFTRHVKNSDSAMSSLASKVGGLVASYATFQTLMKAVNLSDRTTQIESRLNLVVDKKSGESVDEVTKKIMDSANRSRAGYLDTANAVASLAQRAGAAFNNNTNEVIAFTETLNKMYAIAGASAQEQSSSMLQLTQALGSGVLRGEEFNAVFEAAPNIMQAIADYMGKPIGSLREMAAEGKITADIVKNAIFDAAQQVNKDFESMPMTWAQVWNGVMNELYTISQPILELISWLAQNWSILEPIVLGVAAALLVYLAATKGVELATKAWAAAQAFLSGVMALNPIFIIIMGIILLISLIYAVVAAINKVTGSTISATGVIVGALMTAVAFVYNLVIGVLDAILQAVWSIFVEPFLGIIEFIINAFNGGFNSFGDAVANLLGQIISWFLSLGKVVTKIIDAIFGTDWTSGLNSLQDKVLAWGKNEDSITINREAPKLSDLDINRWSYSDAWDYGYSLGESVENSLFGGAGGFSYEDLLSNTKDIADYTGDMASTMEITEEDLKYLRDIAEQEAINRFTTAEIKIDMQNNNSINSNMDIDGIVSQLEDKLYESMEIAAEGVH